MVDTFHALMSKSEHCWWKNNNYTKKLVTERLSEITHDFLIFEGLWQIARHCTWSSNINQSIVELIIN
jgi:hypothetical protein